MVITRKTLSEYMCLEQEISRINKKLDYYANHIISSQSGVVKGSMETFPYAECHYVVSGSNIKDTNERDMKIRNLMLELSEKKKEYELMQLEIDIAIESIDDLEMRQIIELKYIDRCTDEEIGNRLGYERSTIGKKIDKYLSKIDNISQISHS